MNKIEDLSGRRFGRLLVQGFAGQGKHGNTKWKCKCDCGEEPTVPRSCLTRKRGTRSCGCLRKEVCSGLSKSRASSLPHGIASRNCAFSHYKHSALHSGKAWELSVDEFSSLVSSDCYYCGSGPSNLYHEPRNNGDFAYNGLDRLDSLKGYTLDNVVPCCWTCNRMKSKMPLDNFLKHIERIHSRRCTA